MRTTASPARAAAAITAILLAVALAGCTPGDPAPSGSSSASESPAPTETVEPIDTPTPVPPSIDASERAAIVAGIEAGDPAAVGPWLSEPVTYILASSECCGEISAEDATGELISYTSASSGWASPVDDAYLDQVRASPYYADYVPADVLSLRAASDGLVVILGVTGDRITSMLVGHEEVLLLV
ncbi:MAG: hypothetical protein QM675_02430 [Protaetiibacter sp.]